MSTMFNYMSTIIIGCEDDNREKQCNFIDYYYNNYIKKLFSENLNEIINYICYNNDGPFTIFEEFNENILNYNLKDPSFNKIIVIFEFMKDEFNYNMKSSFKIEGGIITITIYDNNIRIKSNLRVVLLPPIKTITDYNIINTLKMYNPYYILLLDINKDIDLNIYKKFMTRDAINGIFVSIYETPIPINTLSYEDPQYYDMYYYNKINDISSLSNTTHSLIVISDDIYSEYYFFLHP